MSFVFRGDATLTDSTTFYKDGSSKIGDDITDFHNFTGSVCLSASRFELNDSPVIASDVTSSMTVLSASYADQSATASLAVNALTASFVLGTDTDGIILYSLSDNTTITTLTSQTVWYKVAGTTILLKEFNFDMATDNRAVYLADDTRIVEVTVTFSCEANSTNTVEYTIFKNGVIVPNAKASITLGANKPGSGAFISGLEMSQNDYIEVWVRSTNKNNVDLIAENLQLSART